LPTLKPPEITISMGGVEMVLVEEGTELPVAVIGGKEIVQVLKETKAAILVIPVLQLWLISLSILLLAIIALIPPTIEKKLKRIGHSLIVVGISTTKFYIDTTGQF